MGRFSFEKLTGLSQEEVVRRQERDGFNELLSQKNRNALDTLIGVLREPMFLLLIACGALYLLSGEFQEALMLLGFVFVIIGITFYQERKPGRGCFLIRAEIIQTAIFPGTGGQCRTYHAA